jgi:hypothetical protein
MDPNAPPDEESIEISPEADAAMAELVKIFSDPNLPTKPRFRCGVDGPDEFDVMFESIMEEQFGDSEYKQWIRRLYELGLISRIPREWVTDSVKKRTSTRLEKRST